MNKITKKKQEKLFLHLKKEKSRELCNLVALEEKVCNQKKFLEQ